MDKNVYLNHSALVLLRGSLTLRIMRVSSCPASFSPNPSLRACSEAFCSPLNPVALFSMTLQCWSFSSPHGGCVCSSPWRAWGLLVSVHPQPSLERGHRSLLHHAVLSHAPFCLAPLQPLSFLRSHKYLFLGLTSIPTSFLPFLTVPPAKIYSVDKAAQQLV